jgi:hypothetical protein
MSDEEKKNQSGLVSSADRGLATRSSGLVLLSSQQVRIVHFPPDRSIGVLEVETEDNKRIIIDACGKVIIPARKRLRFDATGGLGLSEEERLLRAIFEKETRINFTDSDVVYLEKLYDLESLDLSHTYVTDVGLLHLPELPELEILDLTENQIIGTGLMNFQRLTNLKDLNFTQTQLTDAGLAYILRIN